MAYLADIPHHGLLDVHAALRGYNLGREVVEELVSDRLTGVDSVRAVSVECS